MSAGGDSSDGEPRLALENLPNSIDLVDQSSPLASSEPGQRLDGHLNLAAGAWLVRDAGNYAVDEQTGWLPAWPEGASARVAALPGKSRDRGWLPTAYASKYGSSKTLPLAS